MIYLRAGWLPHPPKKSPKCKTSHNRDPERLSEERILWWMWGASVGWSMRLPIKRWMPNTSIHVRICFLPVAGNKVAKGLPLLRWWNLPGNLPSQPWSLGYSGRFSAAVTGNVIWIKGSLTELKISLGDIWLCRTVGCVWTASRPWQFRDFDRVFYSVAVIKHWPKATLGRKGAFHLAACSQSSKEPNARTQGRRLK